MADRGKNPTHASAGPDRGPAIKDPSFPWDQAFRFAFAMAIRIVGHERRQAAEDLAQETLRSIWVANPTICKSWQGLVGTAVTRRALNHVRDEETRDGHIRLDMEEVGAAGYGDPKPDEQLEDQEDCEALRLLLEQLDGEFGRGTRAIIELRAQKIEWKEIADILNMRERTCRERRDRARDWLRQRLSPRQKRGGHK